MKRPRVTPEEMAVLFSADVELSDTDEKTRKRPAAEAVPPVRMSIELAHGLVEPDGFVSLHPGDIIHLGQSPAECVNILIDDVFVARGRVLNIDGKLCVEVLSFSADDDLPI